MGGGGGGTEGGVEDEGEGTGAVAVVCLVKPVHFQTLNLFSCDAVT